MNAAEFRKLIDDYGNACLKAGASNNGAIIDPGGPARWNHMQEHRKRLHDLASQLFPEEGKAYVLADGDVPPKRLDVAEWFVLRLAMKLVAKDRCEKQVPEEATQVYLRPFTMVASDRAAAKAEIARRLDDIFAVFEEQERLQAKEVTA